MGGLGETRTVNLTNYLSVLEKAGFECGPYRRVFGTYEVPASAVVARGEIGDGEVIVPYSLSISGGRQGGQIQGVLRFSESGKVYEGLMGENEIAQTASDTSAFFVAGLFGAGELAKPLPWPGRDMLDAVEPAAGLCALDGASCDFSVVSSQLARARIGVEQIRASAAEQKKLAAEQARLAAAESARNAEFAQLSQGITEAWKLADDIMVWARANDHWYNGISEDRVAGILNPHSYTRTPPANLEQARHNAGVVRKMLESLIGTREGRESRMVADGRFARSKTSVYRDCPTGFTGRGGHVTESFYSLPLGIEYDRSYGIPSSCDRVVEKVVEDKPCRGKYCDGIPP